MRCPDCAKFASLELGDPEANDLEVSNDEGDGKVTGSVRIVLTCADCSTELKEASFDVDVEVPLVHDEACSKDQELEVEFDPTSMEEFLPPKAKRQKHMYGAEGAITVTCPCKAAGSIDWKETVQSSHMDEMV